MALQSQIMEVLGNGDKFTQQPTLHGRPGYLIMQVGPGEVDCFIAKATWTQGRVGYWAWSFDAQAFYWTDFPPAAIGVSGYGYFVYISPDPLFPLNNTVVSRFIRGTEPREYEFHIDDPSIAYYVRVEILPTGRDPRTFSNVVQVGPLV